MKSYAIYFPSAEEYLRDPHSFLTGLNDGLTNWNSLAEDIHTFPTMEDAEAFLITNNIMMGEVVECPDMLVGDYNPSDVAE